MPVHVEPALAGGLPHAAKRFWLPHFIALVFGFAFCVPGYSVSGNLSNLK